MPHDLPWCKHTLGVLSLEVCHWSAIQYTCLQYPQGHPMSNSTSSIVPSNFWNRSADFRFVEIMLDKVLYYACASSRMQSGCKQSHHLTKRPTQKDLIFQQSIHGLWLLMPWWLAEPCHQFSWNIPASPSEGLGWIKFSEVCTEGSIQQIINQHGFWWSLIAEYATSH